MLLAFACALAAQAPAPDAIVVSSAPLTLVDNYEESWPSNCAGQPLSSGCNETLVGLYYADGDGPTGLGYANPPRPVLIQLRGGNTNAQFPIQYPWFASHVLPQGFVGVDPNFAPVEFGEDYTVARDDVARLVQYLRYYRAWLNIDADRIFVFGRSFGGIMALAVGLQGDYADPTAVDPLRRESSRPNGILPFSAMADLNCLVPQPQYGEFLQLWFPASTAPSATSAQKDLDSPIWWLAHPEVYGRTWTPRMCLGYAPPSGQACGQYVDPHDGGYGPLLRDAIDAFAIATNDAPLGLGAHLIVTPDPYGWAQSIDEAVGWAKAQHEPQEASIYFVPPKTPITPSGSVQVLHAIGAEPGAWLAYFVGFESGPVLVPGCSNLQTGLVDFLSLGWQKADASGQSKLYVPAPPLAIGLPLRFYALDLAHCDATQLLHKTWLE